MRLDGKVVRIRQNSPEWLAWRMSHIGASDAPVIAGESPWRTPFELFYEKRGVPVVHDADTLRRFRVGHALEPTILEMYQEETGRKVRPGRVLEWREIPRLSASLDGEAEGRVVEAKWASSSRFSDGVPGDVMVQVQQQMGVSGYRVADVAVLTGWGFNVYTVPFDAAFWDAIVTLDVRFAKRVDEDDPPSPSGSEGDRRTIAALHPEDTGEILEPDAELSALVNTLLDAKARAKNLDEEVGSLENTLRYLLEGYSGSEGPDWRVTYRKTKDSERTDWENLAGSLESIIRESAPGRLEDVEALRGIYTNVSPGSRRLLVRRTEVKG